MELNADLGESWYDHRVGDDAALMPYLDACNLACGFHGGDALTMVQTIDLALNHGVRIGAHPSFPDRKHFGRRTLHLPVAQLRALLLYQVSALDGMVRAAGSKLHHLKPHGALYHFADGDRASAAAIVEVMKLLDIPTLYGPPGGELQRAAEQAGRTFYAEGFVDRVYEPSLHLRSRQLENASIDDPKRAAEQARKLAREGKVTASDGRDYPLRVQTLCIHGDHTGAVDRAMAVRRELDGAK
ncbi:5-oxoprolinase subunit PxpA [Neolewinella litorea]|uniref:LamB/YcsF family protein n=1 Tax=Neolewinella litorea TaxID=2562452 RepID=A0A4S4NMG6_9BACT|nr:5-oxoprolinase subunit PxpA [Neolewinella litorea]THH41119.1 LamB/YcsF family protein [Neolewinella litorea]